MKIYSLSNLIVSLILIGNIGYSWFSGDVRLLTIVLFSYSAVACAYHALTKKGYDDYLELLELFRGTLSERVRRFADIIYNAPLVLLIIGNFIDDASHSLRPLAFLIFLIAFFIQFRIVRLKPSSLDKDPQ